MKTKSKLTPAAAAAPPPPPAVRASAPAPAPPYWSGELDPARLRPSPTNPRKTFPEASVAELAASFARLGVLQPLVVRPVGPAPKFVDGGWRGVDHFEIVAGERRYRAALHAGVPRLPVSVRLMTDEEVLLAQLVENDQREDVRPSERAAAYAALAAAGKTADAIAAATGLPLSAVRDLVRLARLPPWLLAAVDAGEVPATTAALVARVPDEANRTRAAACVLLGYHHASQVDEEELELAASGKARADDDRYGWAADPVLSFRETKELLRQFQRELKGSPIDADPAKFGGNVQLIQVNGETMYRLIPKGEAAPPGTRHRRHLPTCAEPPKPKKPKPAPPATPALFPAEEPAAPAPPRRPAGGLFEQIANLDADAGRVTE